MLKIVLWYLLVINVLTILVYGYDKLCAQQEKWRISEATLLWLAIVGGSIGALLGMMLWNHKTQHWKFRVGVPVILLLQVAAVVALWWYLTSQAS